MLNTSFTYVGKDLHIQRYVHPNRINIFVVVQTKTTAQTKTWPAGKPANQQTSKPANQQTSKPQHQSSLLCLKKLTLLIYIAGEYRLGIL